MDSAFLVLLLILPCVIQGLFFDTMMSDCYGIPFMCNLQKTGGNFNQENNSPFMPASLMETGNSNSMHSHQSVSYPASMSEHASFSNIQSMTSDMSHNAEALRNPFFQTQQNIVSDGLTSSNTGMANGVGHMSGGMFAPGIVSGSGNPPKFGPGGIHSLQGTITLPNSAQEIPETTSGEQDTSVCEVTWTRCQHKCITIDPNNLCPICTCIDVDSKHPNVSTHRQSSHGEHETQQTGCRSFPRDCPSQCVGFDEAGCTICTCENGMSSWYEDIWS